VSHALLPAFTLAWRLDVAETIGSVVGEVVAGASWRSFRIGSARMRALLRWHRHHHANGHGAGRCWL
jgi:hypothetical protein